MKKKNILLLYKKFYYIIQQYHNILLELYKYEFMYLKNYNIIFKMKINVLK